MAKKLKLDIKQKKNRWKLSGMPDKVLETEMLSSSHIEISGNNRISIDGCLGVYEYKDTYLKLRLLKGSVILCGGGFNIVYFENRLISVTGKISAIEFV